MVDTTQTQLTKRPRSPEVLGHRLGRRELIAGGIVALGAVATTTVSLLTGNDGDRDHAGLTIAPTAASGELTVGTVPSSTIGDAASPADPSARSAGPRVVTQSGLPAGMALVTSPRLPMYGIGGADFGPLLAGGITDWGNVGLPFGLPVVLLALDGLAPDGSQPVASFPDYEALVAGFTERVGGVAMIPLDQLDARVSVLAVDGFDPLRDGTDANGARPLRIGVVGDIVPGRNVHYKMQQYGDFTRPFLKIKDTLAAFDLTFANLEGNLSTTLPQPVDANPHTFTFLSDPAMLDGFKLAGIDAVSLANNHTHWNEDAVGWGSQGLLDTIASLEAAGLPFFGAGRSLDEARRAWSSEVGGRRVALLGVDGVTANQEYPDQDRDMGVVGSAWGAGADRAGTNPYVLDQLIADVSAAAANHDIVIPYLHMGAEWRWVVPDWVVTAAHAAIDAGATMVVTNHPHVIQGMEFYGGKPIVYSVGNFIFDQMFSVDTRQGLILDLTFRGNQVVGLRTHGVEIEDFHQPRLMTDGEQAAIMDRFWRSTDRLAGR